MEKINTIQKRNKLNDVYAVGEKGNGGAYHEYDITFDKLGNGYISTNKITFQNGPRKESSSVHGVLDTDLLEIVRHRLECFQEGEFATYENDIALYHIETALLWLNKRVDDRVERNVLGTMDK